MKRFFLAAAAALFALGFAAGCGDTQNSIQNNTGATITNIAPSAAEFGGASDFTITVTASSLNPFLTGTIVEWNGQKLTTAAIATGTSTTTVTATVPHALIANPGTAYVNTLTPQTGAGNNGLSNALTFLIYGKPNPVPVLTSISPTSANACTSKCSNVTITLTGSNFIPTSQNGGSSVTYTGVATGGVETAINVTSITSTTLKATIPGSYLAANDSAQINVINPPSAICVVNCPNLGGGDTNQPGNGVTQIFTVGSGSSGSGNSTGAEPGATAEETPAVSQDGRYVAFAAQQNETTQIFVRDTCVGAANGCTPGSQLVSVASDGTAGNAESHSPAMSADGRYVAFSSSATNLAEGAGSGRQVFLRDTCAGAAAGCKASTSLISTDSSGALGGTEAILPSISTSGRFVAFVAVTKSNSPSATSTTAAPASNAAATSTNSGLRQVFVRDTCLGATECEPKTTRISMQPGDTSASPNTAKPAGPAISGLAKQVALPDAKTSTVFTKTTPIDDRVFLAATGENQ